MMVSITKISAQLQRNWAAAGLLVLALVGAGLFWQASQAVSGFRGLRKVGFIAPFSGVSASEGSALIQAVKLALERTNEVGGVQGYRLELIALDDATDPAQAAEDVRELARDPDVLGIVGAFDSNTSAAASQAAAQAGIPLLDALALSGSTARPGTLALAPSETAQAEAISSFIATQRRRRVALLHDSTSNASWLGPLQSQLAMRYGSLSSITSVNLISGDVHTGVEQLLRTQPEVIVYDGSPVTAALLAQQVHAAGSNITLIGGSDLASPVYAQLAGPAATDTVYVSSASDPLSSSSGKSFVAAYLAQGGVPPAGRGAAIYDATRLLLEGAKRSSARARAPARKQLGAALTNIQGYPGVLGPLSFTNGQRTDPPAVALYRIGAAGYPGERIAGSI